MAAVLCSWPPEAAVTQTFPFMMWSSWPHGPVVWMAQVGWMAWGITKSMQTEPQLFAQISAGFGSAPQKKKRRKKRVSPSACRVPMSQAVQHPLQASINTSALSLLCCCLSSPSQKSILISHFCRDVCLSSFNCLGLQEIETEGLRPPARDFVSQCSGALYGWMMNTNLIILGSPGWVFFC